MGNSACYQLRVRQAIRIDPEYVYAWHSLGEDYALTGNRTAALEAVRELSCIDPEKADQLFNQIMPMLTG